MKIDLPVAETPHLLKETTSRCPTCHARAPARVVSVAGKVLLERTCVEHGTQSVCISSDERFYHVSVGNRCEPSGQCCSPPSAVGSDPLEKLSTCLALIEIVDSCNLACPTCFADSPVSRQVDCVSIDDFKQRVDGVIERKGEIEILQLSGGESTIHPQFFELLEWAQTHPSIGYVLINTNGVRFARDPQFAATFEARYRRGKVQLYLQYDGPQEGGPSSAEPTCAPSKSRCWTSRVQWTTGAYR